MEKKFRERKKKSEVIEMMNRKEKRYDYEVSQSGICLRGCLCTIHVQYVYYLNG